MVATRKTYPNCELDYTNSLISGMLNGCYGFGQALGPIMGSVIYQMFGFRVLCTFTGTFIIIFTFLYFARAEGPQAFANTVTNY